MLIEGLFIRPEITQMPPVFCPGQPDVAEAVGVTLEAYTEFGYTPDEDAATESLTTQFGRLASLGYDGRLYVEPPAELDFDELIAVADSKRPGDVEPKYRYQNLWVPGTEQNSYTTEELNSAPIAGEARLAVHNADTTTGVDPLLHFLNLPYDNAGRKTESKTQRDELAKAGELVVAKHPQAAIEALGHRAVVMLVLMDRIRGVNKVDPESAAFVLNRGFMLIKLGRRKVDGGSYVGSVISYSSRLNLLKSRGNSHSCGGVGVSMGFEELNPQTF